MYYVEALRVWRCLTIYAIIIGVMIVLTVLTLWANGFLGQPIPDVVSAKFPLPALFSVSGLVAAVFAFSMGTGLSEENATHLPVAWTKPVTRLRYSLTVFGIDSLGIVAAFAIFCLCALALVEILGAGKLMLFPADTAAQGLRFIALPLAYYGWIAASCSSLSKLGRGISWAVWGASVFAVVLAAVGFPRPWAAIFSALNFVNPARYGGYEYSSGDTTSNIGMATIHGAVIPLGTDLSVLIPLFVIGIVAGVVQWQRLES